MAPDQDRNISANGRNGSDVARRGCIRSSKGPWLVRRTTRNGAMVTKYRYPSDRERQNNRQRERNRRAIAHNIFAGLRAHGNYQLPKNADTNDLLRALCEEAGWHVEDDGTLRRKNAPPQVGVKAATESGSIDIKAVDSSSRVRMPMPIPTPRVFKGDVDHDHQLAGYGYCTCDQEDNIIASLIEFDQRRNLHPLLYTSGGPSPPPADLTLSLSLPSQV